MSIISPPNHAVFQAPVDIPIWAYASDFMGSVTNVEFYAGTNALGHAQRLHIAGPPRPLPGYGFGRDQFTLVWTNPPSGAYALTAVAHQLLLGRSVTSAPVNITVLAPTTTGTNLPDRVSILAVDPIAIEGTNCWVWLGVTNSNPNWTNWWASGWRSFTNCGPKNASFLVRRFGDSSQALTVSYIFGGTASNGVDCVALPGIVTIPGGEADALITVVPIDDGTPETNKTMILTLTASTNAPPDYLLGLPQRAAGLIVDSNTPRPHTGMRAGNIFHVSAAGPDGGWFSVQYSTDLVNWIPVSTNQVVNGAIDFVDPNAPEDHTRFYRALPQSGPPW